MKMQFNKAEVIDRISNNLRNIREVYGCSQAEMSRKCHVNSNMYMLWENGDIMPSAIGLLSLSEGLDISIDELLKTDIDYVH